MNRPLTVGVEEEFLIVSNDTLELSSHAVDIIDVAESLETYMRTEFYSSQIELVSSVCQTTTDLYVNITESRKTLSEAALSTGNLLIAAGVNPSVGKETITRGKRYQSFEQRFGGIAFGPSLCGCHIHVGEMDFETAVKVCSYIRPYLPLVQSMMVNSPFQMNKDTNFASWRSVVSTRWPVVCPTPQMDSVAEYDALVSYMTGAGVMLDENMVYWYARPSKRYPTVEIRVGDVCKDVWITVLVVAIVRALVAQTLDKIARGEPQITVSDIRLRVAHWRAARDGFEGSLVDLGSGRLVPAIDVATDVLTGLRPYLEAAGDWDMVVYGMDRLVTEGTGAYRQRMAYQHGGLGAVYRQLTV